MSKQEIELNKNNVIFKIYTLGPNKDNIFYKDYTLTLDLRISEIKKQIANDISNGENEYVHLENITERIYKDFGKLFFEKGQLPITLDNYKLEQFTNGNRTYSFIATIGVLPKSIIKKPNIESSTLKKLIHEERKKKTDEFVLYTDEFPPLS